MRALLISLVLSGFMPGAWASVVHLKDGRSVEGTITGQDDKSVKMDIDGVGMTYYADEVQDIDGKVMSPPAAPAALPASTADKRALILKLMKITGSRENLIQALTFMKKGFPPEVDIVMDKIINVDEMLEALIPVYDRNLSAEELQGLINFYETDVGRKYLLISPVIQRESMQAGQDYVRAKLAQYKSDEKNQTP